MAKRTNKPTEAKNMITSLENKRRLKKEKIKTTNLVVANTVTNQIISNTVTNGLDVYSFVIEGGPTNSILKSCH